MKQPVIADTGLLQEEWEREGNSFAGWRWGCCKVRAGVDFGCCWPAGGECLAPHSLSVAGRALGPGRLAGASAAAVGGLGSSFPAGREGPGSARLQPGSAEAAPSRSLERCGQPRLLHLCFSLPKQGLTAGLPHRFVALQEWRGADHAVPAGGCGHPPQLREEDF